MQTENKKLILIRYGAEEYFYEVVPVLPVAEMVFGDKVILHLSNGQLRLLLLDECRGCCKSELVFRIVTSFRCFINPGIRLSGSS